MRGNILVIDDEKNVFERLEENLEAHNIFHTEHIKGAINLIKRKDIDLAIIDLNLNPDQPKSKGINGRGLRLSGLAFIEKVRKSFPHLAILAISQYRDVPTISQATKKGADDYIWKGSWLPHEQDFRDKIGGLIKEKKTRDQKRESIRRDILGDSPYTEFLRSKIQSLAESRDSFFLLGEPGLKKNDIVDFLRYTSSFYTDLRTYEILNCKSLSEEDLSKVLECRPKRKKKRKSNTEPEEKEASENPLFELFRKAHKNICLVNHLEVLSLEIQLALFDVIRTKKYLNRKDILDTQFVFCLEKEPEQLIDQGKLHPEFFAYLHSLEVRPLRERIQDLRQIIPDWLQKHEIDPANMPEEIFQKFMGYEYPHNLIELEKLLRELLDNHKALFPQNELWKRKAFGLSALPSVLSHTSLKLSEMKFEVAKLELSYIDKALQLFEGNKGKAAEALGITSGADNLKKSYVDKYFDRFPELVLQYPTVVKFYKLEK